MLVRGEDRYQHFGLDIPAQTDLDQEAIKRQKNLSVGTWKSLETADIGPQ